LGKLFSNASRSINQGKTADMPATDIEELA
jgi:hypothetical protein